ncbi:MAG: hypothetical protein GXW96_11880, partial [Christensenellaceae bacterium]|nr:hypothetical protein [Christensenellaceae bacterium]
YIPTPERDADKPFLMPVEDVFSITGRGTVATGRVERGTIKLPENVEMVMPGDNIEMEIELITPIAIEEGLRFAIREGGRTVGSGVVVSVIE